MDRSIPNRRSLLFIRAPVSSFALIAGRIKYHVGA
jgi:hypothetical protein